MGAATDSLAWPPLPPETTIFRGYRYADYLNSKTGSPSPKVFYLKEGETGLSVGLSRQAVLKQYPGAAGMCQLIVSEVCACPDALSIVQDDADHAEIRGIPIRQADNEKALRIAKYLVRIAIHCP